MEIPFCMDQNEGSIHIVPYIVVLECLKQQLTVFLSVYDPGQLVVIQAPFVSTFLLRQFAS